MQHEPRLETGGRLFAGLALTIVVATASPMAARESVLHNFSGTGDGSYPSVRLTLDSKGNLYGATDSGGGGTCGIGCAIVFELVKTPTGGWHERVLHNFTGLNGISRLVFDRAGNLYGTSMFGGSYQGGFVFELIPQRDGRWTEQHLFNFQGLDGAAPSGGVAIDPTGNLYGTTMSGGANQFGVVYELKRVAENSWKEVVLHEFLGSDGNEPMGAVALDSAGNLYGTTVLGGPPGCFGTGCGTAFMLSRSKGWTFTTIHTFNRRSGVYPVAGFILDSAGNLYGTTVFGGNSDVGLVYELVAASRWRENILYSFTGHDDGGSPNDAVIMDCAGNLYGTTQVRGVYDNGVAFELKQVAGGCVERGCALHVYGPLRWRRSLCRPHSRPRRKSVWSHERRGPAR